MKYILTAQATEDYNDKIQDLADSAFFHWHGMFCAGHIDYMPKGEMQLGSYYMNREHIATYSKDYPANRENFVCPQGGEFIHYLNADDDDIIIQVDADTIMQRDLTPEELTYITPKDNQFISVYPARPPQTLDQVANNLKSRVSGFDTQNFEITPSFLVGNKKSFVKLKQLVEAYWPEFIKTWTHHAGIQWLISAIIYKHFKLKVVDNVYQCAEWYLGFDTKIIDDKLYLDNELVVFNHTK